MKKKKYIMRTVKVLSLLVALVLCTGILQEFILCHADHNRERLKGFFLEDKDSVDVVLIGASEVYADFASAYAYEKYGFTSYPFATQANIVTNYKSQLKTVIERQHPKLVIVEINGALYGKDDHLEKEANFRNYIDNIPFGKTKVEAVRDYAPENELEYYLPIVKYHSVWKDFPKGIKWNVSIMQDRLRGCNLLKGVKTKTKVCDPGSKVYNDDLKSNDEKRPLTEKSEYYLRDFLDYCKSQNIDNIVFARFPHIVNDEALPRFERCNTAADIIAEYGYDFLNFEKDFVDTGLDVNTDFYHIDHMNIYGQKKFTELLGGILCDRYGITQSSLTDSQREQWDASVEYYDAFYKYADDKIKEGKNIEIGENNEVMDKLKDYL